MTATNVDPLAHASAVPDISALLNECETAQTDGNANLDRLNIAEMERYQIRDGKDGSGQLFQKNVKDRTKLVRPWDGCPDPDAMLTDEIMENEVDLDLMARAMAVPGATSSHLSNITAAQMAELTAVFRYVQRVTEDDLDEGEELLAQIKALAGTAVLHPSWKRTYELIERTIQLKPFALQVLQVAGEEAAIGLYTAILDPMLEAEAVAMIQQMFAYLPKGRAKKIVRDLREEGSATFLDRQAGEDRPTVETLIPGYNYFVNGASGSVKSARLHLKVKRYYQADLEATAADNEWNKAFVERAIGTAGQFSKYGEEMRQKNLMAGQDPRDLGIEIWETSVLQFDEETGAAGMYCTVFSPFLAPGANEEVTEENYAEHYLLKNGHRSPPFILARREVNGPGMFDSRGVADITQSNNNVIRNLQKAGVARAHLEVDPPRGFVGAGWTKTSSLAPGSRLDNLMPGATVVDLSPTRGNPAVGEASIERVERSTHRLFAFPDNEVHPARWQPRAMRKTKRTLGPWRQAYTQMVILCYENYSPDQLAEIIGHWPQLTVEDVLKYRVTLTFDSRALDNDWRKDTLGTMMQLLQIDKGGLMDTGLMIQLIGNLTDPTMMQNIVRDPAGASAVLYRKVQQDVNDIMLGNPPPLVEMDASAGMQLKMAQQVIGQNEKYQQMIQRDAEVRENLMTYLKNLQHSVQETQLSPTQGTLGVAQMPQRPVQKGLPAAGR